MKVTHLITTLDLGGAEKQLLTLVKEQISSGIDVNVISLKGKAVLKNHFTKLGCKVVEVPDECKNLFSLIFFLRNELNKSEIIHAHLPRAESLAAMCSLGLNRKLIVSRHNTERTLHLSRILSKWLSRFIINRSSAVIAISNSVKNFLINSGEVSHSQIPKIRVIEYGYETSPGKTLSRLKELKSELNIATIARLVEQKDLPTLLKACSLLPSWVNWKLSIAGVGKEEGQLKILASKLKVENRIFWRGQVKDIHRFLEENDIFVLPSKYEGFGLVLLEAADSEIPIIASNAEAIVEVLGNDYPFLFPVGRIENLANLIVQMTSIDARKLAIKCARSRLKLFQSTLMERNVRRTYEEVLMITKRGE